LEQNANWKRSEEQKKKNARQSCSPDIQFIPSFRFSAVLWSIACVSYRIVMPLETPNAFENINQRESKKSKKNVKSKNLKPLQMPVTQNPLRCEEREKKWRSVNIQTTSMQKLHQYAIL
jgi:hypothetical protein